MKRILSLLLYLAPFVLSAQNCKYTTDKVDPLTGKPIQSIRVRISLASEITFGRAGDDFRIDCGIYMSGAQKAILPAGTLLELKLANGKILTLGSESDAVPTSFATTEQIYSAYGTSYRVSHDQAKELAASGVQYSKMHLSGEQYYEHQYKDKETEKTQRAASCVYWASPPAHKANTAATTTQTTTKEEEEDDSLIESMMRKKQEKKDKEAAVEKAATQPAAEPKTAPAPTPAKTETPATPAAAAEPAKPASTSTNTPQPTQVITPLSGADELMKWKKLLDQGIITKEEFDAQKKKILEK